MTTQTTKDAQVAKALWVVKSYIDDAMNEDPDEPEIHKSIEVSLSDLRTIETALKDEPT